MGSLTLFLGSWCTQDFVCALQEWSLCFPQSHETPVIKSLWPSTSAPPGISSPLARTPASRQWNENLFAVIVLRFVGHPLGRRRISFCCHCFHSVTASPSAWMGLSFLVGSSVVLLMVVQQLVAILVLWQEKMSAGPSTLSS